MRRLVRGISALMASWVALTGALPARAAVSGITVADVTPRAFSVVWTSDQAVLDAAVTVYADPDATVELTPGLATSLVSADFPPALDLGVIKVEVEGLAASSCVYVQTETTTNTEVLATPDPPDLIEVCTPAEIARANDANEPLANDLIFHSPFVPVGVASAAGSLVLLSAPGLAAHPLSAFVTEDAGGDLGVLDLNNLYDAATGRTLEISGGELLQIEELRGRLCADPAQHRLLRLRRAPAHEEEGGLGGRITELELPADCFFADTTCDDAVNILDAQRVLNFFGRSSDECAFNPDLDIIADGAINILDVQSVLNRFGELAPF